MTNEQTAANQESDSSEIQSSSDSGSEYIAPSCHSLTRSEEMIVNQVTRIGLVANNRCPSDILTEEDKVEMETIRKSLGMLPRMSTMTTQTRDAAMNRDKETEESVSHLKTDEFAVSNTTSTIIESERSKDSNNGYIGNSKALKDRIGSHSNVKIIEHKKWSTVGRSTVDSRGRTCNREWSLERCWSDNTNTTNYTMNDKPEQLLHRKCCPCSYSTWCVSLKKNKTLLNCDHRRIVNEERCCRAMKHDMMMCCVCQDYVHSQQRIKHCSHRINCCQANRIKLPNTSLYYYRSHYSPIPQHEEGDYDSVSIPPSMYGTHHDGPVTSFLSRPTYYQYSEHKGSYFQQYMKKKRDNKQVCKYPVRLPSLKLPTTSTIPLQQTQHNSYSQAHRLKRTYYTSHPVRPVHRQLRDPATNTTNYYQWKRKKESIYAPKSYSQLYYKLSHK